jgi:DNA-binding MarR family transcriptional regulator
MSKHRPTGISQAELERAAEFHSALRHFLARTNEISTGAGLTSQRYDLLLAIKTGDGEASTVSELVERLSLPQPAVTELVKRAEEAGLIERSVAADRRVSILRLSDQANEKLMRAFVALREERRQLAQAMLAVDASFRALSRGQDDVAE